MGGAVAIIVEDSETSVEFGTKERLGELGLTDDVLYQTALSNLAQHAKDARIEPFTDTLQMVILDGFYESSLLLLPSFWRDRALSGETLIAIIPARDVLIFGNKADAGSLELMRSLARKMYGEFSHTITAHVFEWDGQSWH